MMISDRMATQSNDVFTCTAPPRNQLPQLAYGQCKVYKPLCICTVGHFHGAGPTGVDCGQKVKFFNLCCHGNEKFLNNAKLELIADFIKS